jgi:hypothetical protein
MKMHELDTANWLSFPFTVNGVNYASKVKPDTSMANRIAMVPAHLFVSMNEDCVRELIGNITDREFSWLVSMKSTKMLVKPLSKLSDKVRRIQELRRSNSATPLRNKKKYTRKTKYKKEY